MIQLRHSVPEVASAERTLVVNLSPDQHAGPDMVARAEFWSPGGVFEATGVEISGSESADLVIVVHENSLYRRQGGLSAAVRSSLEIAPLVAAVDVAHQRVYRVSRRGYFGFAFRSFVYPYILAVIRRLPALLRRPFLGVT